MQPGAEGRQWLPSINPLGDHTVQLGAPTTSGRRLRCLRDSTYFGDYSRPARVKNWMQRARSQNASESIKHWFNQGAKSNMKEAKINSQALQYKQEFSRISKENRQKVKLFQVCTKEWTCKADAMLTLLWWTVFFNFFVWIIFIYLLRWRTTIMWSTKCTSPLLWHRDF